MPPDLDGLKGHFGWLVDALVTWDPSRTTWLADLETILVALSLWNPDGRLWPVLGRLLPNASDLTAGLAGVLLSRDVSVDLPEGTPVYEREMLSELQDAERSKDWGRLMAMAGRFPIAQSHPVEREAVRGLWELDQDRLVKVANRMEAWMRAGPVVGSLPMEDAFDLARNSTSDAVRFAVLDRAMHRGERQLNASSGIALTKLLVALSGDACWRTWLAAFNRYPVRCPQFQTPLGRALAQMGARQIDAYIASLDLRPNDGDGRPLVTRCLAEFHSLASLATRRILWRSAFDRWCDWDFAAGVDGHLTNVTTSVLDYAVVGHLLEGDPQNKTLNAEARFEKDLVEHENQWHGSLSHAITGYNRPRVPLSTLCHRARCQPHRRPTPLACRRRDLSSRRRNRFRQSVLQS